MGIKQSIKRGLVKAERKIFGKPTFVMITTGKGGLTKAEIKDVLQTIGRARKQGLLSALSYEYRPPTFIDRREPIFLTPKDGNVLKARVKVREIIEERYGTQFIIDGGKANSAKKAEITQGGSRLLDREPRKITPKRPKLKR